MTSLTMNHLLACAEQLKPIPKMPIIREIPYPLIRVKRHRKKRLDKKYLKKFGFMIDTSVDGQCFDCTYPGMFGGQERYILMYPGTYARYRKGLVGAENPMNGHYGLGTPNLMKRS